MACVSSLHGYTISSDETRAPLTLGRVGANPTCLSKDIQRVKYQAVIIITDICVIIIRKCLIHIKITPSLLPIKYVLPSGKIKTCHLE